MNPLSLFRTLRPLAAAALLSLALAVPGHAEDAAPLVSTMVVSAKYFDTIRQPIVAGRAFTDHDDGKFPVAVINQSMQRHRWPNEDR